MDIAIMGAGLSGLACAITLEKHGVTPTVYEARRRVGDRFVNAEALLSILTRPVHDCIASLSDTYGIYLRPTAPIQKMHILSANEQAIIEGPMGFTNIRGRHSLSFEAQLAKQTRTKIRFRSAPSYEKLLHRHTHVVMATGDGAYAKEARNFREDLTVSIQGATIEGRFDPYAVMTWIDYDLAPFGYAYLLPFSDTEANLVIAIPDLPENKTVNTDELWPPFYSHVQTILNQPVPVTDRFQITRYPIGICRSARIGNTFFVGNCFGSMMPFLGFGQYAALLTGIYAAYDLCGLGKYEQLTEPLRQSYEHSLVLRRSMEQLNNRQIDRIVRSLSGRLGEKLLLSKRLNPLRTASYLLRPYVKVKHGTTS